MMKISTNRFGPVEIEADGVIEFRMGILGWEDCRRWVLLADSQQPALAWLQSVERPELALAVTDPRRFVPDYRMRVSRRELEPLQLDDVHRAEVLAIVGRTDRAMTLNLKAPVLINPQRRLGRQVVTNGDLPVRYELGSERTAVRRIA